ncbi:MAG TPA: AAA family ATPase, partial [Polyangium sp.]|nr:AAA family ATPase [Polyangium sp.]
DELQFVSVVLVSRTTAQPVSVSAETITDRTEGQLIRAIERLAAPFHGRVEGLRDGTVIVAFPARGAATDQAAMAARTALAIRDLGTSLPLALATGRASTQIGSLYSDAAVRAATLSQFCALDHHAIPIDETTRGLLDMRFSVEQRQGVFFLLAEDALGDVGHLLCGRLAPFVGREREVALIEKIFDDVLEEPQNAAVIVVGEAGAGKSRLGREVVSVLSRMEPKTEIWVARGEAVRAGSSFGMLSSAVHRAAGIHDGEPMQVRHKKLAKFVQERVAPEQAPSLITFLGEMTETKATQAGEDDELRAARRDPVLMRDRIRFAFEDLVDAITEQHPLVLLLEDLHWGDMPSIKVLETIFPRLQRRPFFIMALGRPEMAESFPNLFSEWSPSTIRLGGLSRRACQALISRIVGTNATDDVVASIVERSAGHPLFLEELVRTVAEGASTPTNALPETVLAMVQSRMAKLPPEARRVLRAASVFGEDFWRGGVVALLGATETTHDVDHSLQILRDREFIETKRASRFPHQTEFRFRHALFREAAYAMLTDADRTTGHFLAANFLEQVGETNAPLLAKHFAEAKEPERAAPYFTRAAREALLGGDFDAVLQHGDWVVENSTESELVGEALGLKAEAAQWRGAYEQSGQLA